MTGLPHGGEGLDARRRKLLFRSWHRGMRECDLILGTFANAAIAGLTEDEVDQYEALLEVTDTELLPWLTGERSPPGHHLPILDKILAFRHSIRF